MADSARRAMLILAGVVLFPANAGACAVCVGWAGEQGLHAGFYVSALLLTALPFAVVLVIGAWLWVTFKRRESP